MIWDGFIKGLKKSFSGKDYLREPNVCVECSLPAFGSRCQFCILKKLYAQETKK